MAYFHQPIRIELQLCSIAQPEERETQIVLLGYDAHFCLQLILFCGPSTCSNDSGCECLWKTLNLREVQVLTK